MRKFLIVLLTFVLFTLTLSQLPPNIPREETLIVDILSGRIATPHNFNIWTVAWKWWDRGIQQLMLEPLWIVDPVTGKVICALAEEMPIYNNNFTKMTIKMRKGMYWSDGTEITSDDVVFTIEAVMKNPTLNYHDIMLDYVKKVYAPDKYTIVVELKKPNSRFHSYFIDRWGALRPMPKHIFERAEDLGTFEFNPPISSGPYVLEDYDPNGYWVLWKRRTDWERTPTGKLFGMPKPKYVLYIFYSTTEQEVMAQVRHEMDVCDTTMEGLRIILSKNKYARAYIKNYPYIFNADPCVTGVTFNDAKFPYNIRDVRWALTLAIDIVDFLKIGYDGATVMAALHIPPTPAYTKWYYKPLEEWLKNFELDIGNGEKFKPFDPNAPIRLAEEMRKRGYAVPEDPEKIKEIFGIGWWKYAPDVAEKLLIKHGFKRDKNGKWLLPDGKPWKITIIAHTNPAHPMYKNAFALAQQWKRFGIDVTVLTTEQAATIVDHGDYDVATAGMWPATEPWGGHPDLYRTFYPWKSEYMAPIGETNPGHDSRWSDPRIDKIVEEMEKIDWNDPKVIDLGKEALEILVEEMPTIPTNLYPGIIALDEYYWTGYPTFENPYMIPYSHWPNFKYVLPSLKSTGRK